MPRLLRLRASYSRAASRVGVVAGTPRAKRLAATINVLLGADDLPGPLDVEAMIPPTQRVLVRRVTGGENLWLWYTAAADTLTLHTLTSQPPPI